MKKWLLFLGFLGTISANAQESREVQYIRKHALLAVEEMQLYKIPASITLSQGILETAGGQSDLAEKAYNHFGIKCKAEWTGAVMYHDDDAKGECFRKYKDVVESYRDHSKFLAERPYYKSLFKLDPKDYKAWAIGLKQCGYATNPNYAQVLISKIEKYNLQQFDNCNPEMVAAKLSELYGKNDNVVLLANNDTSNQSNTIAYNSTKQENPYSNEYVEQNSVAQNPSKVGKEHTIVVPTPKALTPSRRVKSLGKKLKYVVATEGESFMSLAKLYDIETTKLASYNELPNGTQIKDGQYVFLTKKKNKGVKKYYKVQEGDNMYVIAQKMGMKLDKLYAYNALTMGEQPKPGQILNLQSKKKSK